MGIARAGVGRCRFDLRKRLTFEWHSFSPFIGTFYDGYCCPAQPTILTIIRTFWKLNSRKRQKMSKQAVLTEKAPKPLPGIYSQAIVANGFVFCSGQVPMDPTTMALVEGDVQAHTVSRVVAGVVVVSRSLTCSHSTNVSRTLEWSSKLRARVWTKLSRSTSSWQTSATLPR